jgi:hypothetical protein
MKMRLLRYVGASALVFALSPVVINAPLDGQNRTVPTAPNLPTGFMHAVPKDFKVILGPFEITTGNEFSSEASTEAQGPDPAVKVRDYYFQSPVGAIRYYAADHSKVLWEGHYSGNGGLKLSSILSETQDGKAHVKIPAGSLWMSAIVIDNPPQVEPVIGATVAVPKLQGSAWNTEEIQSDYTARHEVESQAGTLRFASAQSFTLPSANLSMPVCDLRGQVSFASIPQTETSFDYRLGQETLFLSKGRFSAAAFKKHDPSRLDCKSFNSAVEMLDTATLTADISATDVKLRTSISRAAGVFLARIGAGELPLLGRGRVSVDSIEAVSPRSPAGAVFGQPSVSGFHYTSALLPSVANFRAVANDVGSALNLPDFLSPEQQQLKAINDTEQALTSLSQSTPDVLVHVPGDEINYLVGRKLKEIGIPKAISFGFGKQEVLAFIPASTASNPTALTLHLALSVGDTYLSVRPSIYFGSVGSFSSAQIGAGKKSTDDLAAFLQKQLAPLINPLLKFDTNIKVPIPTNNVYPLDLTNTITDAATGATINVKAAKTQIGIAIPQKALMIDPGGLHLLLHVDVK